jgi:cytochrome c
MFARTLGVTIAALLAFSTSSSAAGDVAAGMRVAVRCAACHSFVEGKNKIGPSLFGVVGRKAGTVSTFNYSSAMKNSKTVWTAAELDAYLDGPKTTVLGNHMGYRGVTKEDDRANLIAYLATLK